MSTPESQQLPALRPVQRTAAHAVFTDQTGAVLLMPVRAGLWTLPGGVIGHGEHPRDSVLRRLREQAGIGRRARRPRARVRTATSDVVDLPAGAPEHGLPGGVTVHTLRLVYDVTLPGQRPTRPRVPARFVAPGELAALALMPFAAEVLGVPARPFQGPAFDPASEPVFDPAFAPAHDSGLDSGLDSAGQPRPAADLVSEAVDPEEPVRMQRPAAYAVLVDGGARILLTRLAQTDGTWTLPGGGIDHGEHPLAGLEREVYEETGLPYTPGPLIDIGSRHFTGRAPHGRLEDFHGVRLVYAGSVPADPAPRVVEVDGSTDLAQWVPLAELGRIRTVATVRESLRIWTERFGGES